MSIPTEQQRIHKRISSLYDPSQLQHQLDTHQHDYFTKPYTNKMFDLHLYSKLALCKFFQLSMMLKRRPHKNTAFSDIIKLIVRAEGNCDFKDLMEFVMEMKEWEEKRRWVVVRNVREYVVEKMVRMFTCYEVRGMEEILGLKEGEGKRWMERRGYVVEGEWVLLEVKVDKEDEIVREKNAMCMKVAELTTLTKMLEKNAKALKNK